MEKQNKSHSFVVIGGGVTGLFISLRLCQKGFKVTLLERQNFLGGLSTSIEEQGFTIDIGPHELLLPKDMTFTKEILELMGNENILEITAKRLYLFQGELFEKNSNLYDVIFRFGGKFLLHSIIDFIIYRIRAIFSRKNPVTTEEYLTYTYGKFLYKTWFVPYLLRKFKTTKVEIDEVKKTFEPPTLNSIFSFVFKKNKQNNDLISGKSIEKTEYYNWYFKFGMKSFIEKLSQKITQLGGTIITNSNIISINHTNHPKIITINSNDEEKQIFADYIIYSTPLSVSCNWFDNVPKSSYEIISIPKSENSIMVFLFVDVPSLFKGWIVNSYNPDLIFFRISQQTNSSSHVAPKGKTLLCVEIRLDKDDPLWSKDDKFIFEKTVNDLQKSNILKNKKIDGYKIIKLKNIYPSGTKSDKELEAEQVITEFIKSYENEFPLSAIEADGGRIASSNLESKYKSGKRETGIYRAIINADEMFQHILEKIK